jgi:predicted DNA-binding transcriptional regulator AlpA
MKLVNATEVHHPTPSTRLLRRAEVLNITGIGAASSLYALMERNEFPLPVKLVPGGRSVAWRSDEIQAWIESRPKAELRQEEVAG